MTPQQWRIAEHAVVNTNHVIFALLRVFQVKQREFDLHNAVSFACIITKLSSYYVIA